MLFFTFLKLEGKLSLSYTITFAAKYKFRITTDEEIFNYALYAGLCCQY